MKREGERSLALSSFISDAMTIRGGAVALLGIVMVMSLPASGQGAPQAGPARTRSADQIFATTCGWCHHRGGREAGKGPRLMGTGLSDAQIAYRINKGRQGYMPAFEGSLSAEEIKALIAYIRGLQAQ